MNESHHYVSQNQNDFFANPKIKYKPDVPSANSHSIDHSQMKNAFQVAVMAKSKGFQSNSYTQSPVSEANSINRNKFYQYSTPDYMRINERSPEVKIPKGQTPPPITVISRTNGWLTVDA